MVSLDKKYEYFFTRFIWPNVDFFHKRRVFAEMRRWQAVDTNTNYCCLSVLDLFNLFQLRYKDTRFQCALST